MNEVCKQIVENELRSVDFSEVMETVLLKPHSLEKKL